MIEILFGESEAGSMKCAKSKKKIEKAGDGPTSVWGNPDLLPEKKDWIPIYGTPAEVICLCNLLDVGNIEEPIYSEYRDELILDMYTQSGWETSEEFIDELREDIKRRKKEYERLQEFINAGEPLRIWYSNAPYSLCGFYWLCHELRNVESEIYVVKLPEYKVQSENIIIELQNWGEVMHEEMSSYLSLQKQLTKSEIRMFGNKWTELRKENRPLRAVIGGQLVSVSEDFYDGFILKELAKELPQELEESPKELVQGRSEEQQKEPIKEARLIGNLLGKYRFSVGDWWYAKRIDYLIDKGRIKIIEDCSQKYRRTICAN